jgi:hypothetical protein
MRKPKIREESKETKVTYVLDGYLAITNAPKWTHVQKWLSEGKKVQITFEVIP